MTLEDLIIHYRELTDDLKTPLLWSTEILEKYAELAEIEACNRKPLLTSSTEAEICSLSVVADTDTYTKHTKVRRIFSAKLINTADPTKIDYLYITDEDELDLHEPGWRTLEGDPTFLVNKDNSVQIVPPPTEDATLWLEVSHIPLDTFNEFTIDSAHHFYLVYYMMYLGYTKSDSDTKSPTKALEYEAIFTQFFGPRPDAYKLKSVRQVHTDRYKASGWF